MGEEEKLQHSESKTKKARRRRRDKPKLVPLGTKAPSLPPLQGSKPQAPLGVAVGQINETQSTQVSHPTVAASYEVQQQGEHQSKPTIGTSLLRVQSTAGDTLDGELEAYVAKFDPSPDFEQVKRWDIAVVIDKDDVEVLIRKLKSRVPDLVSSPDTSASIAPLMGFLKRQLEEEGLTVMEAEDNLALKEGGDGYRVMLLLTATMEEFMEEAERTSLPKVLRTNCVDAQRAQFSGAENEEKFDAASKINVRTVFNRRKINIFEPFSDPGFLAADPVRKPDPSNADLLFFSDAERQVLIASMIETRLASLVDDEPIHLDVFPLHDDVGKLKELKDEWEELFDFRKLLSLFNVFGDPNKGTNELYLDRIRAYFGWEIGFYFSFLGFYTKWLSYPAVAGIFFWVWQQVRGTDNTLLPLYAALLSMWSYGFLRAWERKESELAFKWGTEDLKVQRRERREYIAEEDATKKRRIRYIASSGVLAVMLGAVLISFLAFVVYWFIVLGEIVLGANIASILYAVTINVLNVMYRKFAVRLNDWENHKTVEAYDNQLIQKIFMFEFINNFMSLLYVAIARPLIEEYTSEVSSLREPDELGTHRLSPMDEITKQLASIFVTRIVISNITEVLLPWLKLKMKHKAKANSKVQPDVEQGKAEEDSALSLQLIERTRTDWVAKAWSDFDMEAYESTLDDYNELVIQFAFVILFGVAFPLTAALAMVSNYLEEFVDAMKLCRSFRRPISERASGIPQTWMRLLKMISLLGVLTNAVILVLSSTSIFTWMVEQNIIANSKEDTTKWLAAFVFEHVLFACRLLVAAALPATPSWIRKVNSVHSKIARHALAGKSKSA